MTTLRGKCVNALDLSRVLSKKNSMQSMHGTTQIHTEFNSSCNACQKTCLKSQHG